jgi:hypothetical protein
MSEGFQLWRETTGLEDSPCATGIVKWIVWKGYTRTAAKLTVATARDAAGK